MKSKFLATAAVVAILAATGVARADEISDIKAQSAALKKQNQALEQRLNKLEKQQATQQQAQQKQAAQLAAAPAPTSFMAADLPSLKGALPSCVLPTLDGPLTLCGITLFGTIDAGLGYVSHGLPESGQNYEGEALINKFTNHSYFGIAPNNLSQTTLGVKGSEEILPGVSGVFMASTGINPQSGQLANAPGTIVANNGLNKAAYAFSGDGGRGGQAFNDQLYVGLASPTFGQLTFGRHRSLTTDLMNAYDPAGGSYAYSVIGYSGAPVSGLGATEDARWDDSFKYRVEYGPVRFGAMYKFADGNGGSNVGLGGTVCPTSGIQPAGCTKSTLLGGTQYYTPNNDAAQFDLGGSYGGLDVDGTLGYFHQAVAIAGGNSPLSPAQLGGVSVFTSNTGAVTNSIGNVNNNTMQGVISDNTGGAIAAKYTYEQFKFYAGWSHVIYHNPENNAGIGSDNDQGGYILSQVNNFNYPYAKILNTEWIGLRYAYDPKTELVLAYYHEGQNQFGSAANIKAGNCNTKPSQNLYASYCSGTLDAVSGYVDYHFTKRFDAYAGMMVSNVAGGIANGYNYYTNWAPTAGVRFTF